MVCHIARMGDVQDMDTTVMLKLKDQKENLECKIKDKCNELKKLCIAEAELTGVIPMEIPLGPDESPPKIRRRVGTMFPYSEDILNRLLTKTEERIPKRKIPFASWNKHSVAQNSTESLAHHTWSPSKSPVKKKTRSFTYVHKLKIIKKW